MELQLGDLCVVHLAKAYFQEIQQWIVGQFAPSAGENCVLKFFFCSLDEILLWSFIRAYLKFYFETSGN